MARLRTLLLLLLLGAGLALALSPAFVRDPVTGRRTLGLINPTDEEEVRQGRQYAPSFVAAHDGVYPDPEAAALLQSVVARLGAASHRPRLPYRVTLLNSSVPNAFALPGGEVFLTRGLLARLEDEARFAVVMGHEVGHVNHRHAVRAMNDALVVGLGTSVLAGAVEDERRRAVAAGLASAGGGLLLLRFSRDQEREADERGAEYARRAGYDPRPGLRVFEDFAALRERPGAEPGVLDSWLSSHPLDRERLVDLRGTIDRLWPDLRGGAPAPALRVTTDRWRAMIARVRAAGPAYARLDAARAAAARALAAGDRAAAAAARAEIAAAGALLPRHALFPAVEGSLLLALGDRPGARAALARAVALQPDLLLARERTAALEEADGRLGPAAAEARAAAALDPGSPGPRLLLGGILERSGDGAGAAAAYADAARLAASGSPEERRALARLAALEARPPAAPPGRALR